MGLGKKIKDTLFDWAQDVLELLGDTLAKIVMTGGQLLGDLIEKPLIDMIEWEWEALAPGDEMPAVLKTLLGKGKESNELAFLPILGAIAMALAMALIMAIAAAFMTKAIQEVNRRVTTALLPPDIVVQGIYKGTLTKEDVDHHLSSAGWDTTTIDLLTKTMRPRASPIEYIAMWLRKEISDTDIDYSIAELGYRPEEIEVFKTLAFYIPPVQDMMRFGVRETFNEEIVSLYGMDEEFANMPVEEAQKLGVSEEWSKHYWRAHWELISILQGFQMLHRGVISQDDMNTLLRTLDIMPYWRDKLTAISYRVFTRVDVRRMYGLKILDRDGVKRSYLDLGYNDEKAEAMTEFTVLYETKSDRDLSKAELLKGYAKRILDRETVKDGILAMGYDADEAEYFLALEDVKIADEETDYQLDLIVAQYRADTIDTSAFIAAIGALNLPAAQQDFIVEREQLRKQSKSKLPTREDIIRWYKAGSLTEDEARTKLGALGYNEDITDLYLIEIPRTPNVGTILRLLVKGYIDSNQAQIYLRALGYAAPEIELLVREATEKLTELPKLPSLSIIHRWFLTDIYNESQAKDALAQLNYASEDINRFVTEWTEQPSAVPRVPSLSAIRQWLLEEVITPEQAKDYLSLLEYSIEDIDRYIHEWTLPPVMLPRVPSLATIKRWFTKLLIAEDRAITYLIQSGYDDEERLRFIGEWQEELEID